MNEYIYRLYCLCHYIAKKILRQDKLSAGSFFSCNKSRIGYKNSDVSDFWHEFIIRSYIPEGNEFNGFQYAGYIAENKEWCLPS